MSSEYTLVGFFLGEAKGFDPLREMKPLHFVSPAYKKDGVLYFVRGEEPLKLVAHDQEDISFYHFKEIDPQPLTGLDGKAPYMLVVNGGDILSDEPEAVLYGRPEEIFSQLFDKYSKEDIRNYDTEQNFSLFKFAVRHKCIESSFLEYLESFDTTEISAVFKEIKKTGHLMDYHKKWFFEQDVVKSLQEKVGNGFEGNSAALNNSSPEA